VALLLTFAFRAAAAAVRFHRAFGLRPPRPVAVVGLGIWLVAEAGSAAAGGESLLGIGVPALVRGILLGDTPLPPLWFQGSLVDIDRFSPSCFGALLSVTTPAGVPPVV